MLAVLAEKYKFKSVTSGKISFTKYVKKLIDENEIIFPKMFNKVSKYYKIRKRELTVKEYVIIVVGRFRMMYRYDKNKGQVVRLGENPYSNLSQFSETIKQCEFMLRHKSNALDKKMLKEYQYLYTVNGGGWWLC